MGRNGNRELYSQLLGTGMGTPSQLLGTGIGGWFSRSPRCEMKVEAMQWYYIAVEARLACYLCRSEVFPREISAFC